MQWHTLKSRLASTSPPTANPESPKIGVVKLRRSASMPRCKLDFCPRPVNALAPTLAGPIAGLSRLSFMNGTQIIFCGIFSHSLNRRT